MTLGTSDSSTYTHHLCYRSMVLVPRRSLSVRTEAWMQVTIGSLTYVRRFLLQRADILTRILFSRWKSS